MSDLQLEAVKSRMWAEGQLLEKGGEAGEQIAAGTAKAYKAVESSVVGGYKAIENAVVGGYKKIEDAFVGKFLTKEGESVEDAGHKGGEKQ